MTKRMLIDALHPEETRVVVLDGDRIQDFDFTTVSKQQIKGNIYLAKITRVEPSLQAAFVEYGGGKQGFLPFAEIHPDYYQIPVSDRQRLLEEAMREDAHGAHDLDDEPAERWTNSISESFDAAQEEHDQPDDMGPDTNAVDDAETPASHGESAPIFGGAVPVPGVEYSEHAQVFPADGSRVETQGLVYPETPAAARSMVEHPAHERPMEGTETASETGGEPAPYAALIRVLRSAPLPESDASEFHPSRSAPAESAPAEFNAAEGEILHALPAAIAVAGEGSFATRDESSDYAQGEQPDGAAFERGDGEMADADRAEAETDAVETLDDEEDMVRERRKSSISRRYRIQEVIKRGQIVLVQVIKEERGNKGVSLTTYISLPGRYCVLMPNSTKGGGISRKIAGGEHRKRLRELVGELSEPNGMSIIVRTAGMDRSVQDIRRDYDYLVRLWNQIRETTMASTAPALIYEESDIIKRTVRDMYTSDIEDVIVSGAEAYQETRDFMEMLMPQHHGRVMRYEDATPLFHYYGVENKLMNMYEPTARLRSGGYLVINATEALISIDVNSGRSTGERNIEETAKKTNMEAAEEVARQLRLRDLAGLIVIDFIDMMESRHRRGVERALKDALKADRAKIQIGRISPFGLLEMSRQRLRPSIAEAAMVTCPHCQGRGTVRADNTVAIQIMRALQHELALGACEELRAHVSSGTALYLLNHHRKMLTQLETQYAIPIRVLISDKVTVDGFQIERLGGATIREEQRRGAGVARLGSASRRKPERSGEESDNDTDRDVSYGEKREPRRGRSRRGEGRGEGRGGEGRSGESRSSESRGGEGRGSEGRNAEEGESRESFNLDSGERSDEKNEDGTRRRRSRGGRRRRGGREGEEGDSAHAAPRAEGEEALRGEGGENEEGTGDSAAGEGNDRPRRSRGGRRRGGRNRRRDGDGTETGDNMSGEGMSGEGLGSKGRGDDGAEARIEAEMAEGRPSWGTPSEQDPTAMGMTPTGEAAMQGAASGRGPQLGRGPATSQARAPRAQYPASDATSEPASASEPVWPAVSSVSAAAQPTEVADGTPRYSAVESPTPVVEPAMPRVQSFAPSAPVETPAANGNDQPGDTTGEGESDRPKRFGWWRKVMDS